MENEKHYKCYKQCGCSHGVRKVMSEKHRLLVFSKFRPAVFHFFVETFRAALKILDHFLCYHVFDFLVVNFGLNLFFPHFKTSKSRITSYTQNGAKSFITKPRSKLKRSDRVHRQRALLSCFCFLALIRAKASSTVPTCR